MPPGEAYTLAFLDPPYNKGLGEQALTALKAGGWLAPDALILLEESADAALSLPDGFSLLEQRAYGVAQILFIRPSP